MKTVQAILPNATYFGILHELWGRTPWSARVPLDPLFDTAKSARCDPREADEGAGSGPGGPPMGSAPQLRQNVRLWENYVALGNPACAAFQAAPRRFHPTPPSSL
ncbi:hypothetical protein SBA4_1580010 [Candidatus Sulfopaludibacter sp. SbA4]|nr:hypothetical protein SBA4_1580010 [Candidatus Sulfopaludibacter sp. SbA4]